MTHNKSLGQHWLRDHSSLSSIIAHAKLSMADTVLEIGPGLGTLTAHILRTGASVVAVEYDQQLAAKLPGQFPGTSLQVVSADFLDFDLNQLPEDYKVVANLPYYITSKIIQRLLTAINRPSLAVLLVQKEVAERLAARPGELSILGISAQVFAEVSLGEVVSATCFDPPPKVDSQVVILKIRARPLIDGIDERLFFRLVKAGFSAKRKMLRSSIGAGLDIEKEAAEALLQRAGINPDHRAQDVPIDSWISLTKAYAATI